MKYSAYPHRRKQVNKQRGLRFFSVTLAIMLIAGLLAGIIHPGTAKAAIAFISNSTNSASSNVGSLAVTKPTGLATGNVMVAQVVIDGSKTGETITAPSNWHIIGSQLSSGRYIEDAYYHVVTASEPTSYTWTFSANSTALIGITAYSGENQSAPVDVNASQSNAASTTQTIPAVTTSASGDMLLGFVAYETSTTAATHSAALTQTWNTSNSNTGFFGGYDLLTNAGSTGTFQTTTAGSVASLAKTIALTPAGQAIGITYVASATANCKSGCTSLNVAAPTGWQAGDVFIASVTWDSGATLTPPSGWTQIDSNVTSGTFTMADFYHVAASGDPSSYTWNFSASVGGIVGISDYTGVDTSAPVDVSATATDSNGTSHIAPSVTTNYADDMLVNVWAYTTNATTSAFPSGSTTDWNLATSGPGSNDGSSAAHQRQGTSGSTGTKTATSSKNAISLMHSIALKANIPIPSLLAPTDGETDKILTPVFQLVSASLDGTPLEYKIQICSTSNCSTVLQTIDQTASQAGWSGQDQSSGTAYTGSTTQSSSTTATYTTQTALSPGTQYWWRGYAYDTGASSWLLASNINTFTTSYVPAAPTIYAPAAGATNISITPEFKLATTDQDGDNVQYKLQICADSACSNVLYTYNETSSQSGWSGQDSDNFTDYATDTASAANSTLAYLDPTTQLTPNTQYWYQAYAIDPGGSNTFSSASSIGTFTTNTNETRIMSGSIVNGKIL